MDYQNVPVKEECIGEPHNMLGQILVHVLPPAFEEMRAQEYSQALQVPKQRKAQHKWRT
jgi:hypothetical protein